MGYRNDYRARKCNEIYFFRRKIHVLLHLTSVHVNTVEQISTGDTSGPWRSKTEWKQTEQNCKGQISLRLSGQFLNGKLDMNNIFCCCFNIYMTMFRDKIPLYILSEYLLSTGLVPLKSAFEICRVCSWSSDSDKCFANYLLGTRNNKD